MCIYPMPHSACDSQIAKPIMPENSAYFPIKSPKLSAENSLLKKEMQEYVSPKVAALNKHNEPMHLIIRGVYLGDIQACKEWYTKAQEGTYEKSIVISILDTLPDINFSENVEHFVIKATDDGSSWNSAEGIKNNLKKAFTLIDKARTENISVLLHCLAGRSRSATVLTAYLMWSCNQSYESVIAFIRSKRFWASPSLELKGILTTEYREMLGGHSPLS